MSELVPVWPNSASRAVLFYPHVCAVYSTRFRLFTPESETGKRERERIYFRATKAEVQTQAYTRPHTADQGPSRNACLDSNGITATAA